MALNQVTQGAHVLIKAYPPFYANSFCGGNGYTGNVAVVPNRLNSGLRARNVKIFWAVSWLDSGQCA